MYNFYDFTQENQMQVDWQKINKLFKMETKMLFSNEDYQNWTPVFKSARCPPPPHRNLDINDEINI
jgi:hypothetical protein